MKTAMMRMIMYRMAPRMTIHGKPIRKAMMSKDYSALHHKAVVYNDAICYYCDEVSCVALGEFISRFAIMMNFMKYNYIAECIERERLYRICRKNPALYIINLFYQLEIISGVNYVYLSGLWLHCNF